MIEHSLAWLQLMYRAKVRLQARDSQLALQVATAAAQSQMSDKSYRRLMAALTAQEKQS